jgi:hypothetical protein
MIPTVLKGVLSAAVIPVLLTFGVTGALAVPVQQFNVQLKNVKPDGRYSVVYTSNSFDTTGDAPPALSEAFLRLAKGMTIKPEFLQPSRLCDTAKFAGFLFQKLPPGTTYAQRLDAFPKGIARIEKPLNAGAREIVETCRGAFLGRGKATVDARPLYPDPIPARFSLFLTKPTAKGAIVGIGVVSHYDRTSPIALNEPRYIGLQPIFTLNVFNDPTPDGLFGYKIRLLTQRAAGFRFSVADLRVESPGITRAGKFWATPPKCPKSGQVPFRADYEYVGGLSGSTTVKVPCPRFRR